MPIDITEFEIAKDPSELILNFLKKEPKKAFSVKEIRDGITKLVELQIPYDTVKDSLENLNRYRAIVDVAWLKGTEYYKIREDAGF